MTTQRTMRSMAGAVAALLFAVATMFAPGAAAQGDQEIHIEPQSWSFAGIFGTFDRGALQRGFQVYVEVCSTCHSMDYLYYRNLGEPGGPGFTEAEVAAIAAAFQVPDGPDETGAMFERPALPRDHFAAPYANDEEARSVNGGALPPDLSVITKARGIERGFPWWFIDLFTGYQEQGADYVYAILTGYDEAPEGMTMQAGMSYNRHFPGHQIAMPAPLADGQVAYADGTEATVARMARDVSTFLMWAAEPTLEVRKRIGFQVMIFLAVFAVLLYLTKQKIWARIGH